MYLITLSRRDALPICFLGVERSNVLAARADDQLLRAIHDREIAVPVDRAHVTGVQPPSAVDRLRGLLGVEAIAGHHAGTAEEQLPVLGALDLGPGDRQIGRAHV